MKKYKILLFVFMLFFISNANSMADMSASNIKDFLEVLKKFQNDTENELDGFTLTYAGSVEGSTLNKNYENLTPKFHFKERENVNQNNLNNLRLYILVKFQKRDSLKSFIFLPKTFELIYKFDEHKIRPEILEAEKKALLDSLEQYKNSSIYEIQKRLIASKLNYAFICSPNYDHKPTRYENNLSPLGDFKTALDAFKICFDKSNENREHPYDLDDVIAIYITNVGNLQMECDTWINNMRSNYYMMGLDGGTLYGIFNPKNKTFRFESYLWRGNWLNEEKFKYDGCWISTSQNKDKN